MRHVEGDDLGVVTGVERLSGVSADQRDRVVAGIEHRGAPVTGFACRLSGDELGPRQLRPVRHAVVELADEAAAAQLTEVRHAPLGHQLLDEPPFSCIQSNRRHSRHSPSLCPSSYRRQSSGWVPPCFRRPGHVHHTDGRCRTSAEARPDAAACHAGHLHAQPELRSWTGASRVGRPVAGIDKVEVLVVDNGSTDDTPAIVDRWAAGRPMLRSVTGTGHGPVPSPEHGVATTPGATSSPSWTTMFSWIPDGSMGSRRPIGAGPTSPGSPVASSWPGPVVAQPGSRSHVRSGSRGSISVPSRASSPTGSALWVPTCRFDREVALAAGGFDPTLGYDGTPTARERGARLLRSWWSPVGTSPTTPAHVVHVVDGRRVTRRYLVRRVYAQGRSDVRLRGADGSGDRRALFALARQSGARALLRNWRNDVARITRLGNRGCELVDVVVGRAKRAGMATEALRLALRGERSSPGRPTPPPRRRRRWSTSRSARRERSPTPASR